MKIFAGQVHFQNHMPDGHENQMLNVKPCQRLTHCGPVILHSTRYLGHHWFNSAPSHCLDRCHLILKWSFYWKNLNIFIKKNAFESNWKMAAMWFKPQCVNTLRLKQNDQLLSDNTLKYIFMKENVWILIAISWKYVPWDRIVNKPSLAQIMAWRRRGDKPLSEPKMAYFTHTYMHHLASMS